MSVASEVGAVSLVSVVSTVRMPSREGRASTPCRATAAASGCRPLSENRTRRAPTAGPSPVAAVGGGGGMPPYSAVFLREVRAVSVHL